MDNFDIFKNKTLLITGGTGSFGNAVAKRFLDTDINEIRILSRDEKKQDDILASQGVEISAPAGTPVQAIHTGEVVFSDWLRGFGLLLIVDHGNNYMSLYGNTEALLKTQGDQVESGELIAEAGNSGARKESGIYFEIRHRGQPSDPEPWFADK